MSRPRTATLAMRLALATLLGVGAIVLARQLDPRFTPVFATWLSAESARVPYAASTPVQNVLVAALVASAGFAYLALARGARAVWALVAVVVPLALVLVASAARGADQRVPRTEIVSLGSIAALAAVDPERGYCTPPPRDDTQPAGARLVTKVACFAREKVRPGALDTRQQIDELTVAQGGSRLQLQRVCVSNGETTRCRWRAGPEVMSWTLRTPAQDRGEARIDLSRLAHAANADDALTVEGLPAFAAIRIREPSGQSWDFAADSGREMQGPLLEGHRPGRHVLGKLPEIVALGGALASLLAALMMERRLRRERAGDVRTRSIAVYRDVEVVTDGQRAPRSPEERDEIERRVLARYRTVLLSIVALTVVPVAIAWCRAPTPLPPLPLAQLEPPV